MHTMLLYCLQQKGILQWYRILGRFALKPGFFFVAYAGNLSRRNGGEAGADLIENFLLEICQLGPVCLYFRLELSAFSLADDSWNLNDFVELAVDPIPMLRYRTVIQRFV